MLQDLPTHSLTVAEIAKALAKAQGEMDGAKKSSVNPHFKSKYADLSAVWDCLRDVLPKYGLSVVQTLSPYNDKTILISTLLHTSGEWFKSYSPLLIDKLTSQGLGSSISYQRRYSLAALCGVVQEDDDGNIATSQQQYQQQVQSIQRITPQQMNVLVNVLANCSDEYRSKVTDYLKKTNIHNMLDMPLDMYNKLLTKASEMRDEYQASEQSRIEEGEQE